jgi:hypothetical protein
VFQSQFQALWFSLKATFHHPPLLPQAQRRRWSWCACRAVLIVSLQLALKNSKKESQKCRFSSNRQLNMESSFKAVHRPESLGGPMRFRLTALAPGFFDDKPEFVRLYVPIEDAKLGRLLKGS